MQNTVAGIASWIRGHDPKLEDLSLAKLKAPGFNGSLVDGLPQLFGEAPPVKILRVFGQVSLFAFELEIGLTGHSYPTLPVLGFVEEGPPLEVRLYHSLWALEGTHRVRSPVLADPPVSLPGTLAKYHEALTAGQVTSAAHLFDPDGAVREPSGDWHGKGYSHSVEDFFTAAFAPGGIGLTYHSFVEASPLFAAEYTCSSWGDAIPPQGGGEVWELRGEAISKLRIYDDIQQPGSQ